MRSILWVPDLNLDASAYSVWIAKAVQQKRDGNHVSVLVCGAIGACYNNPLGLPATCDYCVSNLVAQLELNDIPYNVVHHNENASLQNLQTNNPIFKGIDSTIVSRYRHSLTDCLGPVKSRILKFSAKKLKKTSDGIVKGLEKELNERAVDEIWTFNGRTNISATAIKFAKEFKLDWYCLETRHLGGRVIISKNETNYSRALYRKRFIEFITKRSRKDVMELGRDFFDLKLYGKKTLMTTHTKLTNKLNPDFKELDVLLLFSSQDELVSIVDEYPLFYATQADIAKFLLTMFPNKRIGIRYHPAQSKNSKKQIAQEIKALKELGALVFGPGSPVSSYELLFKSKIIVTAGSTISIESVYYGKPTIVCGSSYFEMINLALTVHSYEELGAAIQNPNSIPRKPNLAVLFGGFRNNYFTEQLSDLEIYKRYKIQSIFNLKKIIRLVETSFFKKLSNLMRVF